MCIIFVLLYLYRPQRSWAKVMFLQACVCPRGGGSASVHARIPTPRSRPPDQAPPLGTRQTPPWTRQTPPRTRQTPPKPGRPPGPGRHPPRPGRCPPDQADPPGKQTPEYGLRVAGTHPTGMHSCFYCWFKITIDSYGKMLSIPYDENTVVHAQT